jgi:putative ABC transport system permease protein
VVLRFAARDARRNRASTLLVAVMVGLPVLAASFVDVAGRSAALDPQDVAGVQLGSHATALVTVGFGGALVQSPDGQQVAYSGETSDAGRSWPMTAGSPWGTR